MKKLLLISLLISLTLCLNKLLLKTEWLQLYDSREKQNQALKYNTSQYSITNYTCSTTKQQCNFTLNYTGNYIIQNSVIPQQLIFSTNQITPTQLSLRIIDSSNTIFTLPYDQSKYPTGSFGPASQFTPYYNLQVFSQPFGFRVIRTLTQEVLLDTTVEQLLFSEKVTLFSCKLASNMIFGLGERFNWFPVDNNDYQIFDRDRPADGFLEIAQTYGQQPVYLSREQQGYNLVLVRTINDLDVNWNNSIMQWKIMGGTLEWRIFIGSENGINPEDSIIEYHKYLGGYVLPEWWSTGYHHCRWGYHDVSDVRAIVQGYVNNQIPLDAFWIDIDYMDNHFIFTNNNITFPTPNVSAIKTDFQKKLVVIIDPSIAAYPYEPTSGSKYQPFWDGISQNVFLQSTLFDKYPFLGSQWAGFLIFFGLIYINSPVHYADFFSTNASNYWLNQFQYLKNKIDYDGIWLDMNEIGQFSYGAYNITEQYYDWDHSINYPNDNDAQCLYERTSGIFPYIPHNTCPSSHTIEVFIKHADGSLELNMHSTYGYWEIINTYNALQKILNKPSPFILTRAQMFGAGKYSAHWSGDVVSNWLHLKLAIASVVRHNMYGMPFMGVDICGFSQDTTVELCARWYQQGAFYPFSRNHNTEGAIDQAPFNLGEQVVESARKNLQLRYSLLKHYYSLYLKNQQTGTIFRSSFMTFYNDTNLLNTTLIQNQFTVGDDLLFQPILDQNITQITGYFPANITFYDFLTGDQIITKNIPDRTYEITNYINDYIPVYQRAGSIIPIQNASTVQNSLQLDNLYQLKIAYDLTNANTLIAQGMLISYNQMSDAYLVQQYCSNNNSCLSMIQSNIISNAFTLNINANDQGNQQNMRNQNISFHNLQGIQIMGYSENIQNVLPSGTGTFNTISSGTNATYTFSFTSQIVNDIAILSFNQTFSLAYDQISIKISPFTNQNHQKKVKIIKQNLKK